MSIEKTYCYESQKLWSQQVFFRFLSLGLILFLHFSIYTVTEITGITETKLDNTVYDSEVFNRQM